MPSIGGDMELEGSWTSQLLENDLGRFPDGFDGYWGTLSFHVEEGDSDSEIQVDILDSNDDVLLEDVSLSSSGNRREVDLSGFSSVQSKDIKVRITIVANEVSPIVSDVKLPWADTRQA